MKEIEIKIKLDDPTGLMRKVEKLGGKKMGQYHEHDVMYDNASGNFNTGYPESKQLRLRKSEEGNFLTYKEKLKGEEHNHILQRTEIETTVEDFETMDTILKRLGFRPYKVKEKIAIDYTLDGFTVEFHKLPFLGDFLEIEASEKQLEEFLPKLGLAIDQGINKSYNSLFDDYCKQHGLPQGSQLTFEEEKKRGLQ